MKNFKTSLIITLLFHSAVFSQALTGQVTSKEEGSLPGVNVYWKGTTLGTVTDNNGNFQLNYPDSLPARLIVSMIGYVSDTLFIKNKQSASYKIQLNKSITLKTVEITEKKDATMISLKTLKTEIITEKELKKAACCNLGESFETNASVDITYKDAISGSKEIQVLGLSGAYTQILTESAPLINGLGLTYGLNSIPGTQVYAINVVKGPGSVILGHESMSGMVNIDLKDPLITDNLFVNAYLDNNLRKEINLDKVFRINEKSAIFSSLHADHFDLKTDRQKDSFLDMPLLTTLSVLNKWKYQNRGLMTQNSLKYLYEDRKAGQISFDYSQNSVDSSLYAQKLTTNRAEFYGRTGWVLPYEKYTSLGLQYSTVYHDQQGFYGFRKYKGLQQNANLRFIYNTQWNTDNSLNAGLSFKYDKIQETLDTLSLRKNEKIPGLFLENTFEHGKIIALILGVRGDYFNNRFFVTPRANVKYSITEHTDLRGSIGWGWKTADILAENPNLAASSRIIKIQMPLQPEESINYGVNLNHNFELAYRKGSIGLDAYQTRFVNKVYADYDSIAAMAIFYNIGNSTFSNSFQAEVNYEIIKMVDLRIAYKFLDVYTTLNGQKIAHPFISNHRLLANAFYETFNRKWNMNFTWQWFGEKRLPKTSHYPDEYKREEYSNPYSRFNFQLNRVLKKSEWYIGIENILNFMQDDAITSANDPYGPYFDTAFIWGPLDGRRIYLGWRYKIEREK